MKSPFHGFLAAGLLLTFLGVMLALEASTAVPFLPEPGWAKALLFTLVPAFGFVAGAYGGQPKQKVGQEELPPIAKVAVAVSVVVAVGLGAALTVTQQDVARFDQEQAQGERDCWFARMGAGDSFRWNPPTLYEDLTDSYETAREGRELDVLEDTSRIVWNATWDGGPDTLRIRLHEQVHGQWVLIQSWAATSGTQYVVGYHETATALRFTADTLDPVDERLQVTLRYSQWQFRC